VAVTADGTRIAVLNGDRAYVLDPAGSNTWVYVAANATQIAGAGNRIAVVSGHRGLREGGAPRRRVVTLSAGDHVVLSGDRIGVRIGGEAYVKDGLYSTWTLLAHNTTDLSTTPNRIGIVTGVSVYAKDASIYTGWVALTPAPQVQVNTAS